MNLIAGGTTAGQRHWSRVKLKEAGSAAPGSVILVPLFCCILTCLVAEVRSSHVFSNQFAVHIPKGDEAAAEIAARGGWDNLGQIGSLPNHYLFEHRRLHKRSLDVGQEHHRLLDDEQDVIWYEQQVEKKRTKRDFRYFEGSPTGAENPYAYHPTAHSYLPSSAYQLQSIFMDPLYKEQWYLSGGSKDGYDMNIQAAWKRGFTGKGVVVSILDDGIQPNHPDLILNYDPRASTDINDNDADPTPQDNGDNKHGTRCAGEVAAQAGNNICGVGVAYNASIGGVRMLDGTVNDAVEAKALGLNPDHVDIYSASWGPEDDGKTVDGPGPLARRAFIYGVTNGRRGLGSIFIWASGNGGRHVDSCNCDGYTNSIFTLSISSATQGGHKPWYLEECSSTLATTYSSGTPTVDKSVATVDMDGRLRPDHICTVEHTGTSASAPLAAGMVALALEANRNLSWRDLQHLVVMTSRAEPLEREDGWYVNGVQRKFSHKFGYGLMDAGALVDLAINWAGVPSQHICKSREIREDREIPGAHLGKVKVFMDVDGCAGTNSEIRFLEHVQCKISLRFFPRGNLRILLTSPMGTSSVLLFERPRDVSSSNFDDWPFLSVHFWGEQAHGRWTLEIINSGSRRINQPGVIKKWQLILYGTDANPVRLRTRSLQPDIHARAPLTTGQAVPVADPRMSVSLLPRNLVPREYLYPGASDPVPTYTKPQAPARRSQCSSEYWIPDLGICVNACPEGYYSSDGSVDRGSDGRDNHSSDGQSRECIPCGTRCKSCYNSTSCTACEHNLVLHGTTCLPVCPLGYYEADSSCEPCGPNCGSCTGAMGNECVRCKGNLVLENGRCVDGCGKGGRRTSNEECVPCGVGCEDCDGDGGCRECKVGFQLGDRGFCKVAEEDKPCPLGMYLNTDNVCAGCGKQNCLHCSSSGGECLECKEGSLLSKGDCISQCYDGSFPSTNQKECFKCPKLCTKCTDTETCTECRGDGVLQGGKCLPHCSNGYFNDLGICVQCPTGCSTCIGRSDTDCVTCEEGYSYLKGGSCVIPTNHLLRNPMKQGCEDGSWRNPMDNSCLPCNSNCARCWGPSDSNCRSCTAPQRLERGTSRCIDCCKHPNDQDCCHCDHHSQHKTTILTTEYNAECHVVARRVSEGDSKNGALSQDSPTNDKWADSTVFALFCLSVLGIVVATLVIQRRQRKSNPFVDSDSDPSQWKRSKRASHSPHSSSYSPLSLEEEESMGTNDEGHHMEIGVKGPSFRWADKDYDYEDDEDGIPEETPLVLKT